MEHFDKLPVVVQVLLVLGQEGRGWILVVEDRRRMTNGAGVVVLHPLVGRNRPGPWTRLRQPGQLPQGVLGLHHVGVDLLRDGVHGDQRAVAFGVSEVSRSPADGTGETAEDRTGDQSTGSPQSVSAALLLRLAEVETELTSLSTRHPAP